MTIMCAMKSEWIEKIETYIQGEISRQALEDYATAEQIEDLEEKISWVRNVGIAIEADGLRTQVKQLLAEDKGQQQTPVETKVFRLTSTRWIVGIAASVLLLIGAFWIFTADRGTNQLYAAYEYIDPGLPVVMSSTDDYELFDALTYYGEENYKVTIEKLIAMQLKGRESDTISYYLGASQLYNGDPRTARKTLEKVVKSSASKFTEKAEWLIVMCALRENNITLAKGQLNRILDHPEHEFYSIAQKLKNELEEL